MDGDSVEWRIQVARYRPGTGLRVGWDEGCRLRVDVLGDAERGYEVVVEGDAAGLEALARHVLALAQGGVPSGVHVHLEEGMGLVAPSARLVLEREDGGPGRDG